MARKKLVKKALLDASASAGSITHWCLRYLEWLLVRNYAKATVRNREVYLSLFVRWCEARSLRTPQEITKPILERYQRHLFFLRKADDKPLSYRSQHGRLVAVRGLFRWLTQQNVLLYNPASELELPRLETKLPHQVLSVGEVEQLLSVPDLSTPLGVRDRAILETFYSTGIRRGELVGLALYDVNAARQTLVVRQGKGNKDRVVPIGERALKWIEHYVREARSELLTDARETTLFVTNVGEPFVPTRLTELVREYVKASGIDKTGSCHLLRHTMATLMLEGGAELRFIQEMLGHADPKTTQIYTQVSIRKLLQIHAATHPGARMGAGRTEDADDRSESALLASLAAESAGDQRQLLLPVGDNYFCRLIRRAGGVS
jgi:integrase/recombinase XerD